MFENHQLVIPFHLITCIIVLVYLGVSFKEPESIDLQDWKRKWIIFFAWLNLIIMAAFVVMAFTAGAKVGGMMLIVFVIPIMTNVVILNYLGMLFQPPESIDLQDWKRKWIIFFAWLGIAIGLVNLLSGVKAVKRVKSKRRSKSLSRSPYPMMEMPLPGYNPMMEMMHLKARSLPRYNQI